jgi:hypothetical protein
MMSLHRCGRSVLAKAGALPAVAGDMVATPSYPDASTLDGTERRTQR